MVFGYYEGLSLTCLSLFPAVLCYSVCRKLNLERAVDIIGIKSDSTLEGAYPAKGVSIIKERVTPVFARIRI